jgi:hypothetical protein
MFVLLVSDLESITICVFTFYLLFFLRQEVQVRPSQFFWMVFVSLLDVPTQPNEHKYLVPARFFNTFFLHFDINSALISINLCSIS